MHLIVSGKQSGKVFTMENYHHGESLTTICELMFMSLSDIAKTATEAGGFLKNYCKFDVEKCLPLCFTLVGHIKHTF